MLEKFILRQAIAVVVQVIVKLIDKHKSTFDPAQTKALIEKEIKDRIPASLWGEEWVEGHLVGISNWMVDRVCQGISGGAGLTESVLSALAAKDYAGALNAFRTYFLGLLSGSTENFVSAPAESQDRVFEDIVSDAYSLEMKSVNPQPQSQDVASQQESEEMAKVNDPGVNVLGAQQQQGELANEASQQEIENAVKASGSSVEIQQQAQEQAQQDAAQAAQSEQQQQQQEKQAEEASENQAQKTLPAADGQPDEAAEGK